MQFTTISAGIAILLASLTSASPIEAENRELVARATSATISDYAITCTATSCSYSAKALLLPENLSITFTGTSSGPTISSVIFVSPSQIASLSFSRSTSLYRLVLNYFPNGPGEGRVSFSKNWPGTSTEYTSTSYVGPSSFPLQIGA